MGWGLGSNVDSSPNNGQLRTGTERVGIYVYIESDALTDIEVPLHHSTNPKLVTPQKVFFSMSQMIRGTKKLILVLNKIDLKPI